MSELLTSLHEGSNFGIAAWNALRPVFQLVDRFTGGAQLELRVQGLLALADPTGGVANAFNHGSWTSNSDDPYVRWVDQMLYNNGQPLTAGSAPIYGTYMDGSEARVFSGVLKIDAGIIMALTGDPMDGAIAVGAGLLDLAGAQPNPGQSQGLTAQQALSQAAPAVGAGSEFVGFWWMVGPSLLPLRPFQLGGLTSSSCFVEGTLVWVPGSDGGVAAEWAVPEGLVVSVAVAGGPWWWGGRWRGLAAGVLLVGLGAWGLAREPEPGQRRGRPLPPQGAGSDGGGGASGGAGEPVPVPAAEDVGSGGGSGPTSEQPPEQPRTPAAVVVAPQGRGLPRRGRRVRPALAWCSVLAGVLLAAWLTWAPPSATSPHQAQRGVAAGAVGAGRPQGADLALAADGQHAQLRRIETIRLGERVLGRNPLRRAGAERSPRLLHARTIHPLRRAGAEPEPDPGTWRQVDLELRKPNGRHLYAALLRGPSWLEEHHVRAGEAVWLDMPEMGAQGWAKVASVGPCPPLEPGPGEVVTGTFKHEPDDNVLDVRVEGLAEPLGVTDTHPFWSEDRQAFVAVGQLHTGEHVRTAALGVVAVTSIAHRPREAWVYNLEVHGEHVYEVSPLGVLVHNNNNRRPGHTDSQKANTAQGEMIKGKKQLKALKAVQRKALIEAEANSQWEELSPEAKKLIGKAPNGKARWLRQLIEKLTGQGFPNT